MEIHEFVHDWNSAEGDHSQFVLLQFPQTWAEVRLAQARSLASPAQLFRACFMDRTVPVGVWRYWLDASVRTVSDPSLLKLYRVLTHAFQYVNSRDDLPSETASTLAVDILPRMTSAGRDNNVAYLCRLQIYELSFPLLKRDNACYDEECGEFHSEAWDAHCDDLLSRWIPQPLPVQSLVELKDMLAEGD
jgi:hypothetical protein